MSSSVDQLPLLASSSRSVSKISICRIEHAYETLLNMIACLRLERLAHDKSQADRGKDVRQDGAKDHNEVVLVKPEQAPVSKEGKEKRKCDQGATEVDEKVGPGQGGGEADLWRGGALVTCKDEVGECR